MQEEMDSGSSFEELNESFTVSRKWRNMKNLSDEEILEYIIVYVNEAWDNIKISELYKTTKKITRKAFPTYFLHPDEQDIYIERYLKPPILPEPYPPLYFYEQSSLATDGCNDKALKEEAKLIFGQLDEENKKEWFKKLIENSHEFVILEEEFKAQQTNHFALYIYEQWFKRYYDLRRVRVKLFKPKKFIEIEKAITHRHFKKDYTFPPPKIHKLYLELYPEAEKGKNAEKLVRSYPTIVKNAYEAILDYLKEQFKERTLKFVDSLGASDKIKYVGLKRKCFATHLANEDIFEELYPVDRFPVFKPMGLKRRADQIDENESYKEENIDEDEHMTDEEDMPEDFDAFVAINNSINQLQLLVDYDLDTDSDED